MYFYGTFEHAIDERGRIAIPAHFRRALDAGAVLRSSADGCIELYTHDGFTAEVQTRLGEEASTRHRSARRTRRQFLADVYDVDLDKQGRVLLPPALREHGALLDPTGRAVFVGCGDYVEIWHPERWQTERAAVDVEDAG